MKLTVLCNTYLSFLRKLGQYKTTMSCAKAYKFSRIFSSAQLAYFFVCVFFLLGGKEAWRMGRVLKQTIKKSLLQKGIFFTESKFSICRNPFTFIHISTHGSYSRSHNEFSKYIDKLK